MSLSSCSLRGPGLRHSKLRAYHVHIQLGCIAQGLLQYLAIHFSATVWQTFRGWLRTMKLDLAGGRHALRATLTDFLRRKA